MRPFGRWWLRRTLPFRITALATTATLAALLGLALLAGTLLGPLLTRSTDEGLAEQLAAGADQVRAGAAKLTNVDIQLRVLDISGAPTDGGSPVQLAAGDIAELKAGTAVTRDVPGESASQRRWLGEVVSAPDGAQRLVVAGTNLLGQAQGQRSAQQWLLGGAVLGAAFAGLVTWLTVRLTLRPVERMRLAAGRLPAGERLPLPAAHDELRALAGALNGLLARRDEATARLRRFTGDAAHELRSPVTSIRAQAEVAVAHPDPELAHEVLTEVVTESQRLSGLLDGLLALARSDAGELPPAEPVELSTLVRDAIARLPADSPTVLCTDTGQRNWAHATHAEVELVLDNLLRNAGRYARAQIEVSVLTVGSRVRLVVDDDGPGVPPEHRERVFDRFYRVADDRARSSGGSGLGLALVAEVVRRRGGRVGLTESPEGGARIQVVWRAAADRGL
ncbi:signal transduction histidine kinase [Tamaricihabitans halophyticus]|uniref:histidine kinase n=1 Tax=Tamaricihabitans halophyticus TaxID=1262583 RepID=A0A4R2R347_9PSEU|nr:ATP-binding protein [Tamaricihabitans halophyticus]TCP56254.1 signal transduction histidine kinase [Tamaricihabitans halophyticus]